MSEKYLHEMIDDIEVLIDEAKPARFSPGKIMIEKDVLMTVIECTFRSRRCSSSCQGFYQKSS